MKIVILIISLFCFFENSFSQVNYLQGEEFWFGFMENMSFQNSDVAITSNNGASGVIEIPASNWSQSFVVPANGSIEISLPVSLTQGNQTGIYPFGVKITTNGTISAYLINRTSGSDDATLIKPSRALGYKYYVSTWQEPPPFDDLSEYIIVSTSDQTVVDIVTPLGNTSTITLNEGEIYQFQSDSNLTGTYIESTCNQQGEVHSIAVFSGARATSIGGNGARDHIVSQMYPVDTWGTSFNLVPLPYADNYFINVIARDNGTTVNLNGVVYNLGQGDFLTLNQIGTGYLSSSNPVSVQIFTRGADYMPNTNLDGDPLMINVSPDNLGVISTRFYTFDVITSFVYPQYVQIVTETSNIGNIALDGNGVTNWTTNPLNPSFSYVEVSLPQGATDHTIASSNGTFIAYPSGQLHARSYGYCIGHNTPFYVADLEIGYVQDTVNYSLFIDTICSCEPVWFNASYHDPSVVFEWGFGDGTTITGNPVSHSFSNGNFDIALNLIGTSGCVLDSIVKYDLTVVNCDIEMSNLNPICQGDSVTLSSVLGQQFLWSTGDTTSTIVVSPDQTTTYSLQVDGGVQSICEEITVYVYEPSVSFLDDSVTICSNEEVILSPGSVGDYLWSTGVIVEEITVSNAGVYSVQITDTNLCVLYDTTIVFVNQAPIWTLGSDTVLCDGSSFQLYPIGSSVNGAYNWSTFDNSNSITVDQEGEYWLEIDDGVCSTSDSIEVFIAYPWVLSVDDSIEICADGYALNVEQDFSNYFWSTGDTTSQIWVEESGSYSVEVDNQCGQYGAVFEVIFDCSFAFYLPNSFTPDHDQLNDVFKGEGIGIKEYELMIFNRWGELIFKSNDLSDGWNGENLSGQEAQLGVYTVLVRITDLVGKFHKYTGHVVLVR